jgi:mycofactocin precursor
MAEITAPVADASVRADSEREPVPEPPCAEELVEAELLVEDVSIDGMCGVY